ncbi:MAG: hypothetical protein M1587_05735 [Thaumarchaeota archaeon]|nr:hypothetical protein [Nitrososphaerota archaeon]
MAKARKKLLFALTAILLVAFGAAIFFVAITTPTTTFPGDAQPASTPGSFFYLGVGLTILGLCFGLFGVFSNHSTNSIRPSLQSQG